MKTILIVSTLILSCSAISAYATTYYVNGTTGNDSYDGLAAEWDGVHGPKKTIQAGINASSDTDTVIVADGIYRRSGNRDLDFAGRAITLRSENGADVTIIDCQGTASEPHRGFFFHGDEGPDSVLDGFTITNGYASNGGAICCGEFWVSVVAPTITNCILINNTAEGWGGGIYSGPDFSIQGSSPTITNCIIAYNTAQRGGGLYFYDTDSVITNSIIQANSAEDKGGGIYLSLCAIGKPEIINCTITGNSAGGDGAGVCSYGSTPAITNSILWGDDPDEVYLELLSSPTLNYCNIEGGWAGLGGNNIDSNPMFVDAGNGNYHLLWSSPCVDVGDNSAPNLPSLDLDGYDRIQVGSTGWSVVDMGAYECGKYFTITDIERVNGGALAPVNIELTWNSVGWTFATYDVYYSDEDFSGTMNWSRIESKVLSGGSFTSYTDTSVPESGQRFYWIVDRGTKLLSHDIAGMMWNSVGLGRNLVSTPFVPLDNSLDSAIGDQLTGSFNMFFSDNIEIWDPATLHYKRAWYDTGPEEWKDWDTGGPPSFGWEADTGYWVNILSFNQPKEVLLMGKVSRTGRLIAIGLGRNLCGTAYPVVVPLPDSGLIDSGFTGSFNKFFSDNIEWWDPVTLHYQRAWYDTGLAQWSGWDGGPVRSFNPCDGFWINVLSFNTAFAWSYPRPYDWPELATSQGFFDGFETGNLSALPWATGGDFTWYVTDSEQYEGTYSATVSEVMEDLDYAYLQVTLTLEAQSAVGFYRKVSSEPGYDWLTFQIDGSEKGAWSGEFDWGYVVYPVGAGTRTFRWEYEKDMVNSSGWDRAWIDNVHIFPDEDGNLLPD